MEKYIRDNKLTIALGLKKLRLSKGWTCEELARLSGKEKYYISNIENRKANPHLSNLSQVLGAFGLTMKEFFNYCEDNGL